MTGLVSPASALGTGTWTGKILPPAGLKAAGWLTLLKWSPAEKYWAFEEDAPVAEDGVFSFPGLDAGAEYSLLYNPGTDVSTGYAPVQTLGGSMLDQLSKSSAKAVKATGGPQTVNFPLVRGVAVKGKVSLAAGAVQPAEVETLTMHPTVKVSGRDLHPEGIDFPGSATAALFERDPAGNLAPVAWTFLDPSGCGVTLSYQWLRGGKAIKGATKASYKLTAKDRGGRLSVRVTASKPGYQSAKLVTKASAKVKAAKKKSAKK